LTLAAARAGKHVLCEKPIALNANEAAQLREVGDKVHIMEAFMVRFHPQWLRTRELVQSGALGDLRTVQVWFSYFNRSATNIRNDATKGGGALMDIGCYPIVAGRFLFGTRAGARDGLGGYGPGLRRGPNIQRLAGLWRWQASGFHGVHANHALPKGPCGGYRKTGGD